MLKKKESRPIIISKILILIWIVRPILFKVLGVEFTSDYFEFCYKTSWLLILPISVLIALGKTKEHNTSQKTLSILSHIGFSIVTIILVLVSILSSMCGWYEYEVLYQNKNNSSRISTMHYGCGAGDSDFPEIENRKIVPITKYFNHYKKIAIKDINLNEWEKVD